MRRLAAAAALTALASAAPAAATDPFERAVYGTWTGSGTVSHGWLPVPLPGDYHVYMTGTLTTLYDTGTCTLYFWEDPGGLVAGVPFQFQGLLSCTGEVAHWSGQCITVHAATLQITCTAADGATVRGDVALVPLDAPSVSRFTFAGTLERLKPV